MAINRAQFEELVKDLKEGDRVWLRSRNISTGEVTTQRGTMLKDDDDRRVIGFSQEMNGRGWEIKGNEGRLNGGGSFGERYGWAIVNDFEVELLNLVDVWVEAKSSNVKNVMSVLKTIAKKLLDDNTKTLVKAGFVNAELSLTSEGREQLDAILFEQYKEKLVEAAQEKLDEEKESKS